MQEHVPMWDHQREAVTKSLELNDMALFWEMGCLAGDTKVKINRGGNCL